MLLRCLLIISVIRNGRADFAGNFSEALLDLYVPTLRSSDGGCRNVSEFYVDELKKFTLWATEMFDATTKFPTGILYGSSYDFGNFDECIDIKSFYEEREISGRYCMAKFVASRSFPQQNVTEIDEIDFENGDYGTYFNISMWKKLQNYANKKARNPRNEFYFAFCMPSLCSATDLGTGLTALVRDFNSKSDIQLNVSVDGKNCYSREEVKPLEIGDVIFICVLSSTFFIVTVASLYDYFTGHDTFVRYRFNDTLHEVVLCFSFQRNFAKLTSSGSNVDGLQCMSGMKVYSMFLIILLHRSMFDFGAAITNPKSVEQYYSNFGLTFILNGPLLVDTFFTISGFLATYLSLHHYYKNQNVGTMIMLYFHRYIRMAPTYAVILAFYCTLFVKLGTGPLWYERVGTEREKCRSSWWANLLFINNYVNTENYCMFQSWYMACDMNAFVVVPILCFILVKKHSVGVAIMSLLLIVSTAIIFVTVYVYDEAPILLLYMRMLLHPNTDSTFLKIYIPGHMRAASYFVGVTAGYLKYQMNVKNQKIPQTLVRIGWTACVPFMFFSLHVSYMFYNMDTPAWFSALYACLHHICWSLGVAWMVVAISSGYGPWVDPILSWRPLVLLSRLTYTVYLCHASIQMFSAGSIRRPVFASSFNEVHSTAADILLAYILAFVLTILFESPIVGLEKLIFWRNRQRTSSKKKEEAAYTSELPTIN